MCMQHQRPAKPQKASFRTKDDRKSVKLDRSLMERGDPDFKDLRVKKTPKKKKSFFEKLFS